MTHRLRTAALAAILALGLTSPALAQGLGFGVKGGWVYPDFSTDFADYKSNSGWQGGIFLGGNREGVAGLQVEFNYLRKKAETDLGKVELSYVQIPVFLRLNTPSPTKESFQFYGLIGPTFDVKVGEDLSGLNLVDDFEGLDIGIMGGAGIEIVRVIVEARYSYGLRQLNKSFEDLGKLKGHSFALLVGFRFN